MGNSSVIEKFKCLETINHVVAIVPHYLLDDTGDCFTNVLTNMLTCVTRLLWFKTRHIQAVRSIRRVLFFRASTNSSSGLGRNLRDIKPRLAMHQLLININLPLIVVKKATTVDSKTLPL